VPPLDTKINLFIFASLAHCNKFKVPKILTSASKTGFFTESGTEICAA